MVHRTMGFPHKSKPKSAYCVIWDKQLVAGKPKLEAYSRTGNARQYPGLVSYHIHPYGRDKIRNSGTEIYGLYSRLFIDSY